jgi:signal peptidase I
MTLKEKIIENVNVLLSAYAIAFVIRLFTIEAYQIPSQSMVPSLLVRDILMVEKVTMGARVPVLNWKVPGFMKPERNDIIVFVSPAWKSPGIPQELVSLLTLSLVNLDNTFDTPKNLVKRLVGLPGDTLSMTNKILMINGKPVQNDFVITSREVIYDRLVQTGHATFDLFQEAFDGKKRIVQHLYGDTGFNREEVYQFAEIRVPKKGEVITIRDKNNYYKTLLKLLVERESGKIVLVQNGAFFIEGKEIKEWKVMDNYYFGMGDNRDFSEDCRYFGFIPEKNIFGRPLFRYFPFDRLGFDVNETGNSVKKKSFF